MARPKSEQPKHCRQRGKHGDRGFVKLSGERFYTGPWGTDEAQSEYLRLCAEWIAGGRRPLGSGPVAVAAAVEQLPVVTGTLTSPAPGCSVKAIVAAYWLHAKGRFATCVRTDGPKERYTGELSNIRDALRPLKQIYGETPQGPPRRACSRKALPQLHQPHGPADRRRLRVGGVGGDYSGQRARACEAAFGMPKELRRIPKGETPEAKRERQVRAREWCAANVWTPHQLRHTVATMLRKRYGLDAAHVVLGHSTMTATQLYAEQDVAKAKEIMAEVG